MSFTILLFLLQILMDNGSAQDCLQPADSGERQIPFRDIGDNPPRLPSGTQAIITTYRFTDCCGRITAWQTYLHPGTLDLQDRVYNVTFQVWRPSPTVNTDGCYGLVGENIFTSIQLQNTDGLVSETPEPTNMIAFQHGDVVGYFTSSNRVPQDRNGEGVQLDSSFRDEVVWYHTSTGLDRIMGRGDPAVCPFPVGSQPNRILRSSTNAAPMLSIDLSTFSPCPPIVSRTPSPPPPMVSRTPSPHPMVSRTPSPPAPMVSRTPSPPPMVSRTPSPPPMISHTPPLLTSNTPVAVGGDSDLICRTIIGSIVGVVGFVILIVSIILLTFSVVFIRKKAKKKLSTTLGNNYDLLSVNQSYIPAARIIVTPVPSDGSESLDTFSVLPTTSQESSTDNIDQSYASTCVKKNSSKLKIDNDNSIPLTLNESYAANVTLSTNQAYGSMSVEKQQSPYYATPSRSITETKWDGSKDKRSELETSYHKYY